MHTIEQGGWSANFNTDGSGDAVLWSPDGAKKRIPMEFLAALVAEVVLRRKIRAIESCATPWEVFDAD